MTNHSTEGHSSKEFIVQKVSSKELMIWLSEEEKVHTRRFVKPKSRVHAGWLQQKRVYVETYFWSMAVSPWKLCLWFSDHCVSTGVSIPSFEVDGIELLWFWLLVLNKA
jgi:hypothetical protein